MQDKQKVRDRWEVQEWRNMSRTESKVQKDRRKQRKSGSQGTSVEATMMDN